MPCFIDTIDMLRLMVVKKRKSERGRKPTQFYHLTTEMLNLDNFAVLSSSPVSLVPNRGLMILYIEGLLGSWEMVIVKVKVIVKVIVKVSVKVIVKVRVIVKVNMKVKVTV